MAERRMMSRKVTDDDHFLALSSSAQALYLHLMMSADDDGFNNQVTIAMFRAHASVQDLQALLEARYIYQFENGVIVIRHFRMANALRKDRYNPTTFQKDLTKLEIDERGVYHLREGDLVASWLPDGCQPVANCLPQVRIDKVSVGKDSKEKGTRRFAPPSLDEVKSYCAERKNNVDPEAFVNFYESKGWMVGKNPMKDWKAAIRTWEKREGKAPATRKTSFHNFENRADAGGQWEEFHPEEADDGELEEFLAKRRDT